MVVCRCSLRGELEGVGLLLLTRTHMPLCRVEKDTVTAPSLRYTATTTVCVVSRAESPLRTSLCVAAGAVAATTTRMRQPLGQGMSQPHGYLTANHRVRCMLPREQGSADQTGANVDAMDNCIASAVAGALLCFSC